MRKFAVLTWVVAVFVAFPGLLRAQTAPGTFSLITGRQPVVSLDGLWRFHPGDNPAWASPGFDDSQWPLIRSGESWTKQGYAGLSGYAWYRFTLQVPDGSKPLSLLLMNIFPSYRVYADGRLIGGMGNFPPHPLLRHLPPGAYDLPRSSQHGPRSLQIAIRMWHDPVWAYYTPGGTYGPGSIAGDSDLIRQRLNLINLAAPNQIADLYTYSILAALFGLLALGLFLLNRADREYLWFALVLLASAADAAAQIARLLSLMPVQIFDLSDGCLTALFSVAALLFFSRVLRARHTFWWWFAVCAASLDAPTVFLYWSGLTSVPVSGMAAILCILPSQLWILIVLVRGAVRKVADARLLLVPALLMFGYSVANSLTLVTYQWGWQRISSQFDPTLLQHPFAFDLNDAVNTVFAFVMMAFLIRRFSLARREEERLSREFEAARSVQALLIPPFPPATPGFEVENVYLPAAEVGGDFFHIQPAEDGSLLVIAGDVSGKGLIAAMTVSTMIGAIRNEAERAPAPILRNLNRILYGNIAGFATCTAALIDKDGWMTIASAGNLAPYLNGKELAIEPNLPLGVGAAVEYSEAAVQLSPGDTLTFLSDGVVEARNAAGELFGFERTRQICTLSATQIAQAAVAFGQSDDITVLTVSLVPEPALA